MPSFQISITPKRRAAGRFVEGVRRALNKALAEEHAANGLSQAELARRVGVNRSVVNRQLKGHENLTLSSVGELAWAMGRTICLTLEKPAPAQGNHAAQPPGGFKVESRGTQGVTPAPSLRALEHA